MEAEIELRCEVVRLVKETMKERGRVKTRLLVISEQCSGGWGPAGQLAAEATEQQENEWKLMEW